VKALHTETAEMKAYNLEQGRIKFGFKPKTCAAGARVFNEGEYRDGSQGHEDIY
jgi:hypothetical protein